MKLLAHAVYLVALVAAYGVLDPIAAAYGGSSLLLYPVVALLGFITVLVHELGHAAAAQRAGATIDCIAVWPFAYLPASRRLALMKRRLGAEVGGYVHYRLDRIDARRKHRTIALAGPAANLLLVVLVWLAYRIGWVDGPVLSALAIVSLGAGAANLVPFRGSDGAAILASLGRDRARQ